MLPTRWFHIKVLFRDRLIRSIKRPSSSLEWSIGFRILEHVTDTNCTQAKVLRLEFSVRFMLVMTIWQWGVKTRKQVTTLIAAILEITPHSTSHSHHNRVQGLGVTNVTAGFLTKFFNWYRHIIRICVSLVLSTTTTI